MIDIWSQRGMLVKVEIRDQRVSVFCCLYTIVNKINRWVVWNITYGTFTIDTYEHHQVHTDQPAGCGTSSTSYPRNLFLFGPAMSALPSDENIISKLAVAVYTNKGGPVEDTVTAATAATAGVTWWPGMEMDVRFCMLWAGFTRTLSWMFPARELGNKLWPVICTYRTVLGCRISWIWSSWRSTWRKVMRKCWTPKPAFKAGACRRGMGVWIFDSWLRVTSTFGYLGTPSSDPHLETIQAENWNLGMKDAPTDAATRQIRTSCHLCRWLDTASH